MGPSGEDIVAVRMIGDLSGESGTLLIEKPFTGVAVIERVRAALGEGAP